MGVVTVVVAVAVGVAVAVAVGVVVAVAVAVGVVVVVVVAVTVGVAIVVAVAVAVVSRSRTNSVKKETPLPAPPPQVCGNFLSIDPGLCTGYAWWGADKKLLSCGVGTPALFEDNSLLVRVVIERPQVYPGDPVPPNDLITLAIVVGRYIALAADADRVETVLPHEWKGNLPKKICAVRVMKALSAEERLLVESSKLPESNRHNMMDAIGIGLYAFRGVKI